MKFLALRNEADGPVVGLLRFNPDTATIHAFDHTIGDWAPRQEWASTVLGMSDPDDHVTELTPEEAAEIEAGFRANAPAAEPLDT